MISLRAVSSFVMGLLLIACDPPEIAPPPQALVPTPVHVVQNNSYTTNIYVPPSTVPTPRRESSGFATCDAYFTETERCARALTWSPYAMEQLEKSLDIMRGEDRIIAASGSVSARAEVSTRCETALRAYDDAPCFLRR